MVKNLNETVPGRKDPEKQAAAKARKPPPNPWEKLRAMTETKEAYARRNSQLEQELEHARERLAFAERDTRHANDRARAALELVDAWMELAEARRLPWWNGNKRRLVASAVSNVSNAVRAAEALNQRQQRELAMTPLHGENQPDAPGHIQGLAPRPAGPQDNYKLVSNPVKDA